MFKYPKVSKDQTRRYARGEHVMSKNEASLMRRLQSETGMSEKEVRSHKKYRKMLADAGAPGRMAQLRTRRRIQDQEKNGWPWGPTKAMFMQKACQVLNGDKAASARLYKRYAGGLVDDKRPKGFHYRKFVSDQPETQIMQAIDRTDGQFVYSPDNNEVGFMYADSLTMFSLVYQAQ